MLSTAFILAALASPAPLSIQATSATPVRERYVQIREGERCPRGENGEAIVCGFEKESERYRIPERFREALPEDATNNLARVADAQNASNEGIGSCSNIGPGGFTGCSAEEARAWAAQRRRDRAARDRAIDD